MLFEYAVEPKAIASNWQNFRYLIEKFGFDRGRLIAQFPKAWLREVYDASNDFSPMERKRLEVSLARAKKTALMRSGRPYDPNLGGWLENAISQHQVTPFHAVIAEKNETGNASIIEAADVDEHHILMASAHTWDVPRTGASLAAAMGPLLRTAKSLFFVDPYFDVSRERDRATLKACLDLAHSYGNRFSRCEIHFSDRDSRLPIELLERDGPRWLRGVLPEGMSVALYVWDEKPGGEDFHARYLLTDVGGVGVEAGFTATGSHQNVQMALLASDFCERKIQVFAVDSSTYNLAQPVLEILSNGTVKRI